MSATTHLRPIDRPVPRQSAWVWRAGILVLVLAAGAAGLLVTQDAAAQRAVAQAGPELTRLLRAMAVIKLALVAGPVLLVEWRLRFPASAPVTAGYLAGLALAAAGPGLIWDMAHVAAGAAMLHAGLLLTALVFWRDKGSPAMLKGRLARR